MKRHASRFSPGRLFYFPRRSCGDFRRTLDAQATAHDAGNAEQTGAEEEQRAGLRNATAADLTQHERFAAQTAVAEVDAALPEVTGSRTTRAKVRDVPCFGTRMGSIVGVAQREPIFVARSHRQRGNRDGDRVNVITEAVAEEESAVPTVQGNRSGAEVSTEGRGADLIADCRGCKAAEEPHPEGQLVRGGGSAGDKAVGDVLDTAKEVRVIRSSDEECVVVSINGAVVKDHCVGNG